MLEVRERAPVVSFRAIKPERRYRVNVRGVVFDATVVRKIEGRNGKLVQILPDRSERYTFRFVPPRMVVEELV